MRGCWPGATRTRTCSAAAEQGIEQVDLVCVNLYPFEQTVARGDASEQEIIENIDIGGPTMIRAAAKNSAFAAVVVDPDDYEAVLGELRESEGRLSLRHANGWRPRRSRAPPATTPRSPRWFAARTYEGFPPTLERRLREGQRPALRREPAPARRLLRARGLRDAPARRACSQLHGKELSFNNLLDLSSARELVEDFDEPACAIVKHNNPCGCAVAASGKAAYERAFACDPQSAYGGVIAVNRPVDRAFAEELSEQFIEVLLAPGFDPEALEVLQEKKNVRLLELRDWPPPSREVEGKPVIGGQLVQTRDVVSETREQMRVDDHEGAERGSSGRTCCSRGGSAATCAPTRS